MTEGPTAFAWWALLVAVSGAADQDVGVVEVTCVDGSVLAVLAVPVLDRDRVPYEVTLRLLRNDEIFGQVGERCGYFLTKTVARLRAAYTAGSAFPGSSLEVGVRAWAEDSGADADHAWRELQRYLPRDRELFSFRARDPDDPSTVGELRVTFREERQWTTAGWSHRCLALLDVWGASGQALRSVMDPEQLLSFLEALVADVTQVGAEAEADVKDEVSALH